MSDMMLSTGALIALMVTLVLVLGGILVSVRVIGGRAFNEDHDRRPATGKAGQERSLRSTPVVPTTLRQGQGEDARRPR